MAHTRYRLRAGLRRVDATLARCSDELRPRVALLSIAICVATALIVTFSLYPGWFFFDSAKQWGWARLIANSGFPARLADYGITSHWPIFNTLIDVPFYWLTGEAGFYIFVQALLFNLALYLIGAALLGRRSVWLVVFTLAAVLSPISVNYSVFQSSDTPVALCALVAVAVICDGEMSAVRRTVLLAASVWFMSLTRYNALPVAVFFIAIFFWQQRHSFGRARSWILAVGVLVLVGGSVAAARAYEHTAFTSDSATGGAAMRLLDAAHYTPDPVIHALIDPYIKTNPELRKPLAPACYEYGGWCSQLDSTPLRRLSTRKYMRAYLHLLLYHPIIFTRVTWHFAEYQLGLAAPLDATQIGRTDITPPFPAGRMTYNGRRYAFLAALWATLGAFGSLAARAGWVCLLGFAAALLLRRRGLAIAFVALAVGYLGPLLLLAATNNFRYSFPVTIVGYCIVVAGCCVLARSGFARIRARWREISPV